MEKYLKKYAKNSIVVSILFIIFSLFLIFKPVESLNISIIALGVVVIFNGVMHAVTYFGMPKEYKAVSFELVQGVLFIILGIIIILNPLLINGFLTYILGIWIVIQSILKIQLALNIRTPENKNWIIVLLLGIVSFLLGVIVIVNPFTTMVAITTTSGIMLFMSEIINISEAILIIKS